ncbi:HlyD family efflux transporter periplasmic adaptor subunit [Ferruginibacter paludis]|uniref:HlyD family secretion protein n=1 Tax=Ferruginibacter paludis TaxID=1310417 RepID=UPI0025B4706A|nr:HlyD family efflux transporter periplasmic adaptor subunit [Ferruginibacter paludis]MDN3656343.1 HlyD family efflux transporter periplasmic adaptor subunit [Ferruginibacter paludis]
MISTVSCKNGNAKYDATGTFEADEIIVSAEATGKIMRLNVEEGATLIKDSVVGNIDPSAIELQKEQAASSVDAITQKTNDALPQINILQAQMVAQTRQIAVQEEQLKTLQKEQARFTNLVNAGASPVKQLDDINGQVNVLQQQILASKSQLAVLQSQVKSQRQSVAIQNRGILSEKNPMEKKVAQIQDQLNKTNIVNPVTGTVLTKYADANEFTNTGKAIYKIADLTNMKLRAYITGDQLAQVKLNQPVKVLVDDGKGKYKELQGIITWISDKAEFTPKTIQTKEERANLVYAVKINVKNDGYLKIGMYGEVIF